MIMYSCGECKSYWIASSWAQTWKAVLHVKTMGKLDECNWREGILFQILPIIRMRYWNRMAKNIFSFSSVVCKCLLHWYLELDMQVYLIAHKGCLPEDMYRNYWERIYVSYLLRKLSIQRRILGLSFTNAKTFFLAWKFVWFTN